MSMDIERSRPTGFTLALSEQAIPPNEPGLSKDVATARLRELFTTIRTFEQEQTDALRDFVRTTNDWTVAPEGRKQAIDTCFSGANGEGFHIQLTCERSRKLYKNPTFTDAQIIEIIRSEATEFRVLFYDADVMAFLHADADPNETLLNKVRGHYKRNPAVIQVHEIGVSSAFTPNPLDQFWRDGKHTAYAVALTPTPINELVEDDIQGALARAQVHRIRHVTETAHHAEEYRELHHQLDASDHWPAEARQKLVKRMLEIQAINGYHEPTLDWRTVIIPADNHEDLLAKDVTAWDEHSVEGLRSDLSNSAEMRVLEDKLTSRSIAAQALKALQAPTGEAL